MTTARLSRLLVAGLTGMKGSTSTHKGDVLPDGLDEPTGAEGPHAAQPLFSSPGPVDRLVQAQGPNTGCQGVGVMFPSPADSLFEEIDADSLLVDPVGAAEPGHPRQPIDEGTSPSPDIPEMGLPDGGGSAVNSPPMFNLSQPPVNSTGA